MSKELRIAALMCSRVCHDLISPVSALNNGIEVLTEDDDPEMRDHALSLIELSGRQASNKLQFARLAFGASSFAADALPFSEAQTVLDRLLISEKLKTRWLNADRTVDKSIIRILMNLAVLAADVIPRGGELIFDCAPAGGEFAIDAVGPRAKIADAARNALLGDIAEDDLDPRSIQPFVTGLLIEEAGLHLSIDAAETSVRFGIGAARKSLEQPVRSAL